MVDDAQNHRTLHYDSFTMEPLFRTRIMFHPHTHNGECIVIKPGETVVHHAPCTRTTDCCLCRSCGLVPNDLFDFCLASMPDQREEQAVILLHT